MNKINNPFDDDYQDKFNNQNYGSAEDVKKQEFDPTDDYSENSESESGSGNIKTKQYSWFAKMAPSSLVFILLASSTFFLSPTYTAVGMIMQFDEAITENLDYSQLSLDRRIRSRRKFKMFRKGDLSTSQSWRRNFQKRKKFSPKLAEKYNAQEGLKVELDGPDGKSGRLKSLEMDLDDGTKRHFDVENDIVTDIDKDGKKTIYKLKDGTMSTDGGASFDKIKNIDKKHPMRKIKNSFDAFTDTRLKHPKSSARIRNTEAGRFRKFKDDVSKKALASLKIKSLKGIRKLKKKKADGDEADTKLKSNPDADFIDPDNDEYGINEAARPGDNLDGSNITNAKGTVEARFNSDGSTPGKAAQIYDKSKKYVAKVRGSRANQKFTKMINSKGASAVKFAFGAVTGVSGFFFKLRGIILNDKLTKMLSLAGYATLFLATFSNIRDGTATEEEIGKTMNILTATEPRFSYKNGKFAQTSNLNQTSEEVEFTHTAFDSQYFRYITNGNGLLKDTAIDESAKQYQIGASGKVAYLYEKLDNQFINNGFTQTAHRFQETIGASPGGQIIGGIIFIVVGVLTGGLTFGIWAQEQVMGFIVGKMIEKIMGYLMMALVSSMAGMVVNSLTSGEDAGNAIVVGSAVTLSTIGMRGGNVAMTKNAALAYLDEQNTFIAQKGKEIEATHSPFDTTTRHTLMGRISFAMLPYKARFVSFIGSIGSIFNIAKTSLVSLLPTSNAISNQAEVKNAINFCNDPTIKKAMKLEKENGIPEDTEIALTPFCTPIVGIPVNYLDSDYFSPQNVLERFAINNDSEINRMWTDANNKTDDQKHISALDYGSNSEFDKFKNLSNYFRPKDSEGFCNLAEAEDKTDQKFGKNIYTHWSEQEKTNPCSKDWFWAVNDRGYKDSEKGYQYNNGWEMLPSGTIDYNKNKLNEFKVNCIDRGAVPLGMVDKVPRSNEVSEDEKANNDSWTHDFFGIEAWKAKSITEGKECLVSGDGSFEDRQKVDFALYFMDIRVDNIMEENYLGD